MKLNRWYARRCKDGHVVYRMPYEVHYYEESGRPGVKYRTCGGGQTGCSGRAWLSWAKGAEVMPVDFWPPEWPEDQR